MGFTSDALQQITKCTISNISIVKLIKTRGGCEMFLVLGYPNFGEGARIYIQKQKQIIPMFLREAECDRKCEKRKKRKKKKVNLSYLNILLVKCLHDVVLHGVLLQHYQKLLM